MSTDAPLVHALLTGQPDPRVVTRATPRTRAVIEDAHFMAHTGETFQGAARRLGLNVNSLERLLTRHGQHPIIVRLRTNEKNPS